jgi:flagellar biosynthesis protein
MTEEKDSKQKTAIALRYDKDQENAPKVVAKGKGYLAEQIIAVAKEAGIEIHKDEDLSKILDTLDIDTIIPVEAYTAVAEILSYIYSKKGE